jgi:hypothetical protein
VDLEATFLDQSTLSFDLTLDPASLVSEAEASAAFARSLVPQVGRVPFLIAAPVTVTVACAASPSPWHPDAVVYPNLETWLQPLIEALSGADRLLVSPSLVGSIRVTTRRPDEDADALSVAVTYPPDRLLPKSPLRVISL